MPDIAPSAASRALYGRLERLAMLAGALLMLVIVAASVVIARRTDADLSDAARAQATGALTARLLEAVVSAESSQRGYLLTGRTEYLGPYNRAVEDIPKLLAEIGARMGDEPRLPRWRGLIEAKMAELGETVRLERAGRHADALALVLTDRGRDYMVASRAIAAALAKVQNGTLVAELHRSQSGTRLLVAVDVVVLIQLVLLSAFVARSIRQTVRALRRSGAALREANLQLQAGRDRLEAEVAERTADLTSANEEIQRFAYIVSHDLRAPLLNIIGFTSELEDATQRLNRFVAEHLEPAGIVVPEDVRLASQEDLPEAIRFIQTSTSKMDRLISAILRLSREGRRVLAPERLDMGKLVAGVFDSMRHQADRAQAELVLGPMPPIVSDRIAVEQVFSNLVENALKYGVAGRAPRIEVEGAQAGALVRYEVRDNGRGVAPRDLERIFELFRRAGQQDMPGEGIGLAHVRRLLQRLGGRVDCQSEPDVGSTFIVTLPATLAPGPAAAYAGSALR